MENKRCWAWARSAGTFALFVILCGTLGEGTHFRRHSRHSGSDDNSSSNKSVTRTERNLHKPYFSNCSKYHPIVKEEESANTFVIQVHADDQDPADQGGTITYSLERERLEKLKFDINNVTGMITTTQLLNRDEPAREKEFWLTVVATDNGHIRLSDMCSFKVTIEDVNDNGPLFDKGLYNESVPKDLHVGSVALTISATDIDDGDNSVIRYSLDLGNKYFKVNAQTGDIILIKPIDKEPGYLFNFNATATDMGKDPQFNSIPLKILVVDSHKKAPSFTRYPLEPILIRENFSDFDEVLAQLEAESNIDDKPQVTFELLIGRTEQTNALGTFKIDSTMNFAEIRLAQVLDYERITEYTLIVRVTNDYNLAAEMKVIVKVLDVNDNSPVFIEIKTGTVMENKPGGEPVTQVHATDADGTFEHNQVTYELKNYQNIFSIDRKTGIITTLKELDREEQDIYNLKIVAIDSSPSANSKSGEHNYQERIIRIEIADENDNPPQFTQSVYTALSILENVNQNTLVIQLNAKDVDTASIIHYSIISGNTNESFHIEKENGKITVNNYLDYENQTEYNLTVLASDGKYTDTTTVIIFIENVNDNPPKFEDFDNKNPTIKEETLIKDCITTVKAYDPDIQDRNADQHIVYSITNEDVQSFIDIDNLGCMTLKKPLDRDPPNGRPMWSVKVKARDTDGGRGFLQSVIEVNITLIDINDNAPFLDMHQPVVWDELQNPGRITILKARDYDSDNNGAPFKFRINKETAGEEIAKKFHIEEDIYLSASVTFDREEKKSYDIPIEITDSGSTPMTGTSLLVVVIGDKNDNKMKAGSSSILFYNYMGKAPNTKIGRVYVEDEDDWDLPDKNFNWGGKPTEGFELNPKGGMITVLSGTPKGSYTLQFIVTEESEFFGRHSVRASVNVTIKEIPEEAVMKSGSVRFFGISEEEFVTSNGNSKSKKDRFHEYLTKLLNCSSQNVDVFTVLHSPHQNNKSLLDVRFSAHGSPYYAPEKLNTIVNQNLKEIERKLEVDIMLVNIDECLFEKVQCNTSCRSFLNASTVPYSVFTNTSSFVGVRAIVDPQCTCHVAEPIVCLNDGKLVEGECVCPPGLDGPRCESLDISFQGEGWAIMPPLKQACLESHLGLDISISDAPNYNGLVFYIGPMSYNRKLGIQDFMALEVQNGTTVLYVDYGTGTAKLIDNVTQSNIGSKRRIDVYWTNSSIKMEVNNCEKSSCIRSLTEAIPVGTNQLLNVNSPLQIGGSLTNLENMAKNLGWNHTPIDKGFVGCIRNLTINGNTYNLGMPAYSKNINPGCYSGKNAAISFSVQSNFLVAILVCVTILLILLLAVVVHRRKRDDLYKDMDDIRENIINYEDEGGGEVDTGFDLNVLRRIYDAPLIDSKIAPSVLQGRAPDEVPDICGFLDTKKDSCDKDPDTNPFDDVRHYAYEGEGNSDGSLSSLASCTDDGDLKFNYLSNFGPRFRKLADMYGEEPSDEESDGVEERESESWC